MRNPANAPEAVRQVSVPATGRGDAPVELVCLALVLALVALLARIATVW